MQSEDSLIVDSPIHGARTWRRIDVRPYVNRKGESAPLAVWRSSCVICGEPFEITIPSRCDSPDKSKSFAITTCLVHRMSPSEAMRLRYAPAAERKGVFEEIKAGKLAAGGNPAGA